MIKAKIKQGTTTLVSVKGEDEEAMEKLSKHWDKLIKSEEKLKLILDWEKDATT